MPILRVKKELKSLKTGQIIELWSTDPGSKKDMPDFAKKQGDEFLGYVDEAGLSYTIPQGAYYVMVDCSAFGVTDDNEFCRWMAREVGVAAVPGSSFFHEPVNHLIRLHFSRSEAILAETGLRLKKLKSLI